MLSVKLLGEILFFPFLFVFVTFCITAMVLTSSTIIKSRVTLYLESKFCEKNNSSQIIIVFVPFHSTATVATNSTISTGSSAGVSSPRKRRLTEDKENEGTFRQPALPTPLPAKNKRRVTPNTPGQSSRSLEETGEALVRPINIRKFININL